MVIDVYGICDPVTREVFYVGLTINSIFYRLSQHGSDPASACYHRLRQIRESGYKPVIIVFKTFDDMEEARRFERDMIMLIDDPLVNREQRYSLGGRVSYGKQPGVVGTGPNYDLVREPFDDGWGTLGLLSPSEEE